MNRRGSKNISAIEDRILSQTERAAQMRAGMSPDAYMLWRGEGRERRRKEWIERETRLANPEFAEAAQ